MENTGLLAARVATLLAFLLVKDTRHKLLLSVLFGVLYYATMAAAAAAFAPYVAVQSWELLIVATIATLLLWTGALYHGRQRKEAEKAKTAR